MSKPFLFVIARGDSKRYELAMKHSGDESAVEIVYDRRASDRRTRRAAQVLTSAAGGSGEGSTSPRTFP